MKIENIKYDNFMKFIEDVLLPKGDMYDKLHGFVYRGERTNKFKLLPGALREEQIDNLFYNSRPYGNQWQLLFFQIYAEYTLLRNFYKEANHNGLKVPKVDRISKNYTDFFASEILLSQINQETYKWLPDDVADLAALAQHYGVLTRLLDWTYDIYVALYFASIGAIKKLEFDENDTLVIWALNARYIQSLQPTESRIPLNFIVPPYHDNPNLNAQKGILSYWEINVFGMHKTFNMLSDGKAQITDRTPLDELLKNHCKSDADKDDGFVLLYKFEIPIKECIPVYEYLKRMGYTAARLFPGYSGVTKSMEEQHTFQKAQEKLLCSH